MAFFVWWWYMQCLHAVHQKWAKLTQMLSYACSTRLHPDGVPKVSLFNLVLRFCSNQTFSSAQRQVVIQAKQTKRLSWIDKNAKASKGKKWEAFEKMFMHFIFVSSHWLKKYEPPYRHFFFYKCWLITTNNFKMRQKLQFVKAFMVS